MTTRNRTLCAGLTLLSAFCFASLSNANARIQSEPDSEGAKTSQQRSDSDETHKRSVAESPHTRPAQPASVADAPERSLFDRLPSAATFKSLSPLTPRLAGGTMTWIAIVLILALTIQSKPWLSWHNLDGLMLALAAFLLALRDEKSSMPADPTNHTVQFWSYSLLAIIAVYWCFRGAKLVFARSVPSFGANVSEGAMTIFMFATLAIGFNAIVNAPLTDASRDGLAGGIFMAETGMLPYGEIPGRDARSPLLYALHAGAVKLATPTNSDGALAWSNRDRWLSSDQMSAIDPTATRLINGVLFVLLFGGVAWLGHRLHSVALGQTMVVLFVIFPGTLECLNHPEILLPAALLTWSLALLTVPAIGSLGSAFLMVLAGAAWPWAWLGLPILLAYSLRYGLHALGVTAGIAGAVAALAFGLLMHTNPTLPRVGGALAAAGIAPRYEATLSEAGELKLSLFKGPELPVADFKSWIWNTLLSSESAMSSAKTPDETQTLMRKITASGKAAETLQREYRKALHAESDLARLATALRTVLEATWLATPESRTPAESLWTVWLGAAPDGEATRILARRLVKGGVGVLMILLVFRLLRGPQPRTYQLFGAFLATFSAAFIASEPGPIANWPWLLPIVLTLLALSAEPLSPTGTAYAAGPATPRPARPSRPSVSPGVGQLSNQRISVEN